MGKLARFDLDKIISCYGCKTLIETGTGMGTSTMYAAKSSFDKIYTIELHPEIAKKASELLAVHKNVSLVEATSEDALKRILPDIPASSNTLYWLDAHYPGEDFGYNPTDDCDFDTRLPLEKEIEIVKSHRNIENDVFIIDDLRIYEDGPFFHGNIWQSRETAHPNGRNISFVKSLLGDTHKLVRLFHEEGYLIAVPKDSPATIPSSFLKENSYYTQLKRALKRKSFETWSVYE